MTSSKATVPAAAGAAFALEQLPVGQAVGAPVWLVLGVLLAWTVQAEATWKRDLRQLAVALLAGRPGDVADLVAGLDPATVKRVLRPQDGSVMTLSSTDEGRTILLDRIDGELGTAYAARFAARKSPASSRKPARP